MDGDQGGRAGGVDGHRRALEPERVGDAAGDDAGAAARGRVALEPLGDAGKARQVVLARHARVHAGPSAAQGPRVDPRPFEEFPGRLQHHALLRVHRQRLARADPEERGVEAVGVADEAAAPLVARPVVVGIGVEELVQVPAAVGREDGQRLAAVGQQSPQRLGRVGSAGEAAGHAHDGDRLGGALLHPAQALPGPVEVGRDPLEVVDESALIRHGGSPSDGS